jgi:glycosyltransferase involved in cell wall biosynthesis
MTPPILPHHERPHQGRRILLISPYPPARTGLAEYAAVFAAQCAARGFSVRVLSEQIQEPIVPTETPTGVEVDPTWTRDLRGMRRLFRAAQRDPAEVVHVSYSFTMFGGAIPGIGALFVLRALARRDRPLVVTLHDVLPKSELTTETLALYHVRAPPWVARRAVGTILKFLARAADRIMVHSEAARSVLQNDYGVPAAKITITEFPGYPPTPRADGAAPGAAAERPAAPSILYYGFLAPYKGVETLLAAYARARALAPDRPLRLVIAGTNHPRLAFDYAAVLRQEAVRVGAPDVSFPGYVDDRTSAALFSGSSLVVLPYLKTAGSSGTLASAMGANRPVVVTDLPTLIGQLNGYPNSRVVRPGDVAELAEVLLSVAEHQFVPRPPKALTTNAVRHWADLVDLTAEVYSSAIAARRPDFSDFATEFGGDTELPT